MTSSHIIVSLFSLLAFLLIFTPSHALTVKLPKNSIYCVYRDLKATEQYTGTYVISGYDEKSVTVTIRQNDKKEFLFQNDKLKEGTWDFSAPEDGEYRTCFKNHAKKENLVSFDLSGSEETNTTSTESTAVTAENIAEMVKSLKTAVARVKKVRTNLGFQKTRSNMHHKNMKMLLNQMQWSVIFKVAVLMIVAAAQMYILTGFLNKQRKVMV